MNNRAYEIARSRAFDGCQRASATMVCKVFDKENNNKNVKYLLCAIDVFTKYTWV